MKTYEKRYRPYFAGALVSVLISTVFAVALQFFKGQVLDSAITRQGGAALRSALSLASFILGETLFFYLYRRLGDRFAAGCVMDLKRDIFASALHRDYAAFQRRPQGEYLAKYAGEADAIRSRRFCLLPLLWEILFRIVLVGGALFLLDWRVALVTLGLLTTPLYVPKLMEKRVQRAQSAFLRSAEEALAGMTDWLRGFEIVKNFSVEGATLTRFGRLNDGVRDKLLQDLRLGAAAQVVTTLMSYLSYFIVLVCAALLVLNGTFSAGDFFVAIGMIDQLSYPLISLAEVIRQLIAIRPACASMEQFLAEGAATPDGRRLEGLERELRFDRVSFRYPDRPPVLQDLSFTVKKGGRYLIQGPSGCGKTTAVNLLLRYYDPCGGSIQVDGVPIESFSDTYGCFTVVRQEAVLFRDSLRHNLTMYREADDIRLSAVLRGVGLERFAGREALDTLVEENGSNLSGGEKRRICLARALLRETDVLILDEPLANLDEETAGRIEDLLLSITDRTLLVVSHQFTPEKLSRFDRVLSLDGQDHAGSPMVKNARTGRRTGRCPICGLD